MFMLRRVALAFVLSLTLVSSAQAAELGWKGFELRVGVSFGEDLDTGFGLGGALNFGEIMDGLFLYPGFLISGGDGSAEVEVPLSPIFPPVTLETEREVRVSAVGAEVRYFPSGEEIGFFVGGGPYLFTVTTRDSVSDGSIEFDMEERSRSIGLSAVAGYRFGDRVGLEIRFDGASSVSTLQVLGSVHF